ncbi:MAG: hypothetical protein H7A25_05770 [Leptospiraceae bacterium]|nr:hypothetical protein [Leptospiraceae bacterium]MCP5499389.1 hypothetical protein [Leptospiraceae bacterium]
MKIDIFDIQHGNFSLNGGIEHKYTKISQSELIKDFVPSVNKVAETYANAIYKDGKLTGQEKMNLMYHIEDIMQKLILVRTNFINQYPPSETDEPIEDVELKKQNKFLLTADSYHFVIKGYFSREVYKLSTSFKIWLEAFRVKVKEFYGLLGKVLEDRVITKEETVELSNKIDELLQWMIIACYKLKFENIPN